MILKKVFRIPFNNYFTRAYTFGNIKNGVPLIILHGGPGGTAARYEPFEILAEFGIPIIFYDQLGSGYSKVPKNHKIIWNSQLFCDELDNLINFFKLGKYMILGHSWGGMLALEWLRKSKEKGLEKLILFSALPSTKMWNEEHLEMISNFPKNEKQALIAEYEGKPFNMVDRKLGIKRFYNEHVRKRGTKVYQFKRKYFPKTNREIYERLWGSSELFGTGLLRNWNCEDVLKNIKIPTLILSGKYDESSPAMNKFMNESIEKSTWIMFENSHHVAYIEEPDAVMNVI